MMLLSKTEIKQFVQITDLTHLTDVERQRLGAMGFVRGRKVVKLFSAWDIAAYQVMESVVAIRHDMTNKIFVAEI